MTGLTSLLFDKIDSYCPPITNDVIQQNSWHFEPQGSRAQASIILQVTARGLFSRACRSPVAPLLVRRSLFQVRKN